MATRQYIGARYVPTIFGEWDKSLSYEALTIVTHLGASYTSKKPVPANIEIDDDNYWVLTGNYNQQLTETINKLNEIKNKVIGYYTPEEFGAKGDGITDDTNAIIACITKCISDNKTMLGSGNTYLISSDITIPSYVNIDFNNSVIKSNNGNIINFNGYKRYTKFNYVCGICFDNVIIKTTTCGVIYYNLSFYNINNFAVEVADGVENIYDNIYIRGNGTKNGKGFKISNADNEFHNMIMVDTYVCFDAYLSEQISDVHAWILTPAIYNGSSFFDISRGNAELFLNNIYCDTYNNFINLPVISWLIAQCNNLRIDFNTSVTGSTKTFALINGNNLEQLNGSAYFAGGSWKAPDDFIITFKPEQIKLTTDNVYSSTNFTTSTNFNKFSLTTPYIMLRNYSMYNTYCATVDCVIKVTESSANTYNVLTDNNVTPYEGDRGYITGRYSDGASEYNILGEITLYKTGHSWFANITQDIISKCPNGVVIWINETYLSLAKY